MEHTDMVNKGIRAPFAGAAGELGGTFDARLLGWMGYRGGGSGQGHDGKTTTTNGLARKEADAAAAAAAPAACPLRRQRLLLGRRRRGAARGAWTRRRGVTSGLLGQPRRQRHMTPLGRMGIRIWQTAS